MWNEIARCIKRVTKDIFGMLRVGAPLCKNTWWWNEEIKTFIKVNSDSCKDLKKHSDGVNFERYSQGG